MYNINGEFWRENFSNSLVIDSVLALIFGPAAKWESLARVPHTPEILQGFETVIGEWCPAGAWAEENTNSSGEKTSKMSVDRDQPNISLQSSLTNTQGSRVSRT